MRLTLKYFTRASEHIEVDCPGADSEAGLTLDAPMVGLFSELNGTTIGLFARGGGLFVWLDGEVLTVGDDLAIDHAASGAQARLAIRSGQKSRVMEYTKGTPVSTVFYSEDDEDADFGLWMYNVLNSEERMRIFLSSWSRDAP